MEKKRKQKSRERERGGVSGGRCSGGRRCFVGRFSVGSASLKKLQTSWLAKRCLVLLLNQPASLYDSTVYVHTRYNIHMVSVCFLNLLNYDTDYRIVNMPTQSFNACIYTCVCLYSFCKSECLPFSWKGQGFGPLFFHSGGPLGPYFEILEATLV